MSRQGQGGDSGAVVGGESSEKPSVVCSVSNLYRMSLEALRR